MEKLLVKTNSANYNIYINNSFDNLSDCFSENNLSNKKICIVSDSNVAKIYLDYILNILKPISLEITSFVFDAGEENKNIDTVQKVYKHLIDNNFDRKSVLVALGGGVTGDLTGFVAATYMRGIQFVQVPTTLLSQVDSSVGGKVGIDFDGNKNLVGAFYQPVFVYTNTKTLDTLDNMQFAQGMAEAIKHGLIRSKDYYNFIFDNKDDILNKGASINKLVFGSCEIKREVVSIDEKESGLREILNFGHTFGHSVETLSNFTLMHGSCVAIGMLCSLMYSLEQGYITYDELTNAQKLLSFFGLSNTLSDYDTDNIITQMYKDKKTKNNILNIICLDKIGNAKITQITSNEVLTDVINKTKTLS